MFLLAQGSLQMDKSPSFPTAESRQEALGSPWLETSCPVSLGQQTLVLLQDQHKARCLQPYSPNQTSKTQCRPSFLCQEPAAKMRRLAPASLQLTPLVCVAAASEGEEQPRRKCFTVQYKIYGVPFMTASQSRAGVTKRQQKTRLATTESWQWRNTRKDDTREDEMLLGGSLGLGE